MCPRKAILAISFFIASSITTPVKKLTGMANRVIMGDMSNTGITVTGSDARIALISGDWKNPDPKPLTNIRNAITQEGMS